MNKYAAKNIDKDEAQSLYDNGLSIRALAKHYNVAKATIQRLKLVTRTASEGQALIDMSAIHSDAAKKKLSKLAKERNLGGYRPHPNKGQYYKDIWFDSTWEVTVAKSLDKNNISWCRPKIGFVWTDDGKKYYPDFYLPEYDVYLDPKNSYLQKKDAEKISEAQKRNNITVLMLNENQLDWQYIARMV